MLPEVPSEVSLTLIGPSALQFRAVSFTDGTDGRVCGCSLIFPESSQWISVFECRICLHSAKDPTLRMFSSFLCLFKCPGCNVHRQLKWKSVFIK